MATYKIINITDMRGKRDMNFNKTLELSYVDGMERKNITIKPGETLYFTTSSLPISVHSLRSKKLIAVTEISSKELADIQNKEKNKGGIVKVNKNKSTTTTTTTKKKKTYPTKKKTTTTSTKVESEE